MSLQRIIIDSPETADQFKSICDLAPDATQAAVNLGNYIHSLPAGVRSANVKVLLGAVAASGTLTGTSVIATDVVIINGTSYTCVSSGATGNQFNVGASDTITMANLAATINASSDASGLYSATSAVNVVTVSAVVPGKIGNAITLVSSDATIVASAGRLAGGAEGTSYNLALE